MYDVLWIQLCIRDGLFLRFQVCYHFNINVNEMKVIQKTNDIQNIDNINFEQGLRKAIGAQRVNSYNKRTFGPTRVESNRFTKKIY